MSSASASGDVVPISQHVRKSLFTDQTEIEHNIDWHLTLRFAAMLLFGKPLMFSFFLVGRLILTTHALYFQSIRVGYGDRIVKYYLTKNPNQVIKRDFTGPLGVRLFDKTVIYKSNTL